MAVNLLHKPYLRRELIVTLAVKFVVIFIIWFVFFSEPLDKQLDGPQVADVLFGGAPAESPHSVNSVINLKEK